MQSQKPPHIKDGSINQEYRDDTTEKNMVVKLFQIAYKQTKVAVTVSIDVSEHESGKDIATYVSRADRYLYAGQMEIKIIYIRVIEINLFPLSVSDPQMTAVSQLLALARNPNMAHRMLLATSHSKRLLDA